METNLRCDICGKGEDEVKLNVHSAMNVPLSMCYCEECDKKGFITEMELIRFLATSKPEKIAEIAETIHENAQTIEAGEYKRRRRT